MLPGTLISVVLAAAVLGAAGRVVELRPEGGTVERVSPPPGAGVSPRWYAWPVEGRVQRPFQAPAGPFGAGHRGIDIAAAPGTPVRAAERGRVSFAGRLAGELFVSIDHPDGVRTTYSWLSAVAVRRGDELERSAVLGASGGGHPGSAGSHLHFGARVGETYIDPLLLLEPRSVAGLIHLAPLREGPRGQ